ncbi:MAG TPA: hypothetical protein VI603_18555 [Saprospiraceae bacterium]|nr:hypothetical protein [Saprospiraceae bacterium]
MHEQKTPEYVAGLCNIGPEEIARRYRLGYVGLVLTILLVFFIESFDAQRAWRLLICAPVGLSLSGFLQAMYRFCFGYGFIGVFSVKKTRELSPIVNAEYLRKDRNKALALVAKILGGTMIITIFYYMMPVS